MQQYRLRKIKKCYLPCKCVGFALNTSGMKGAVSATLHWNGDATGQAAHTKLRQGCSGKGSQPSTIQPPVWGLPRAGGCSGQPGLAIRVTLAHSSEVAAALQMVPRLRPSPFIAHPSPMRKTVGMDLQKSNVSCSKIGLQRTAKHLQKSKLNQEEVLLYVSYVSCLFLISCSWRSKLSTSLFFS